MSHYHLEIVIPPTDDVDASVKQILHPFDENGSDDDETRSPKHVFWDYWEIGGRWSGAKLLASVDEPQVAEFYKVLQERKITVSNVTVGKQTLMPTGQVDLVDALWREFFPACPIKTCPLFDSYRGADGDIMKFLDVPKSLKCGHVIVAGMNYQGDGLEAKFMVRDSIWNGVTYQKTTWDETFGGAISDHLERLKNYKEEYAAKLMPADDWIVVTVDYHS